MQTSVLFQLLKCFCSDSAKRGKRGEKNKERYVKLSTADNTGEQSITVILENTFIWKTSLQEISVIVIAMLKKGQYYELFMAVFSGFFASQAYKCLSLL